MILVPPRLFALRSATRTRSTFRLLGAGPIEATSPPGALSKSHLFLSAEQSAERPHCEAP